MLRKASLTESEFEGGCQEAKEAACELKVPGRWRKGTLTKPPEGDLAVFMWPCLGQWSRASGDARGTFVHLFEVSSHFASVLMANFAVIFLKKRSFITN